MPQRATVRQVAEETGLSIATVSRVFNDQQNVAARTREVVLEAADRLGRRPPNRRAPVIHLRCPYVLSDYFGLIVSAVVEAAAAARLDVVLDAGELAQRSDALARLPSRDGVGAAILVLPPEPAEALVRLRDSGFPFVVVDPRTTPPGDVAAVSAAHFTGARALMAHLVGLGHRRVGLVAGPPDWLVTDARTAGHLAALADVGVLPDPALVRHVPEPTIDNGRRAAAELLDLPEPPTALVGFNDKMAAGALRAATERGLRVPQELSIAGFDDIELSRVTDPPLTTVRQPLAEMGRMAVMLVGRLLDEQAHDALHVELATELIVRGSTGPVPR